MGPSESITIIRPTQGVYRGRVQGSFGNGFWGPLGASLPAKVKAPGPPLARYRLIEARLRERSATKTAEATTHGLQTKVKARGQKHTPAIDFPHGGPSFPLKTRKTAFSPVSRVFEDRHQRRPNKPDTLE